MSPCCAPCKEMCSTTPLHALPNTHPSTPSLLPALSPRYKYLHNNGDFHNPFDHGWRKNCHEVCHPHCAPPAPHTLTESEGENSSLLKVEHGASMV